MLLIRRHRSNRNNALIGKNHDLRIYKTQSKIKLTLPKPNKYSTSCLNKNNYNEPTKFNPKSFIKALEFERKSLSKLERLHKSNKIKSFSSKVSSISILKLLL